MCVFVCVCACVSIHACVCVCVYDLFLQVSLPKPLAAHLFIEGMITITIVHWTVTGKLSRQFSLPTPLNYSVANPTYTKGIEIQQATIAGRIQTQLSVLTGLHRL